MPEQGDITLIWHAFEVSDASLRLTLLLSVLIHWEGPDTNVTVPKSGRQDVAMAESRVSA